MKDEEGKIVEFIDENPPAVVAKKKKKTVKAKAGTENKVNVPEIEAEDTLAMIKNALKSGPGQMASEFGQLDDMEKPKKKKKKPTSASNKKKVKQDTIEEEKYGAAGAEMEEDFQVLGDLENTSTTNSKKADSKALKKPKKATKKKKERLDGITRFFNDYGESPHLQAIEISYLKYLEA